MLFVVIGLQTTAQRWTMRRSGEANSVFRGEPVNLASVGDYTSTSTYTYIRRYTTLTQLGIEFPDAASPYRALIRNPGRRFVSVPFVTCEAVNKTMWDGYEDGDGERDRMYSCSGEECL